MPRTFRNPIIPGFHPDPSICRVGDDYYLVTSTFEYFPGLPLFHSRDLVHWRQVGHALNRPSQLNLDRMRPSGGLYAPTIRHHNGTFYIINTLVNGAGQDGNFIVTAPHITGPWSDPVWLDDAPGIDPSLLFDEDGRVWYVGNRGAEQSEYEGHCEIWLQELDLHTLQLIGPRRAIWQGALKGVVWTEGPHLYKKDGWYYLLISEAGTEHNHAVTIARSQAITGPYLGHKANPILTHRHLGLDHPIVGTGHADLVETQSGEWWMVLLAMRPYDGYFFNLGRETFLTPVRWEDGWPVVNPGVGRVEFETPAPNLPPHPWPSLPACDHFETEALALCWNFLRTPRESFYSLTERPGHLRLKLRPERLGERANPSLVVRRQQHIHFAARAKLEFTPRNEHECAGLALLQNDDFHFRFVVSSQGVCLIQRAGGDEKTLAEKNLQPGSIYYFKVDARGQAYSFYAATSPEAWVAVAENVDGRILSTPVAGGFVGAMLGMYASSNGQPSENVADWDWFEYAGMEV